MRRKAVSREAGPLGLWLASASTHTSWVTVSADAGRRREDRTGRRCGCLTSIPGR